MNNVVIINYEEGKRILDRLYDDLTRLVSDNNNTINCLSELSETIVTGSQSAVQDSFGNYANNCYKYHENLHYIYGVLEKLYESLENYNQISSEDGNQYSTYGSTSGVYDKYVAKANNNPYGNSGDYI